MSCIFSDVSGHSVKSVSTVQEQVLPHPSLVGGEQGGSAAIPQNDMQGGAIIPRRDETVDEALSILETQSDCLSFPNLQGTTEEEVEEEEGEEVEGDDEEEEDDDDDGNGVEGSQDEGDDGDEGEEDRRREDAELEQEVQEHPPLEGGAPSEEVRFLSLLYHCFLSISTVYANDDHHELFFHV